MLSASRPSCKITAKIEPVIRYPEKPIGVVHGSWIPDVIGMKPEMVARYAITVFAIGDRINGIIIIGFNTIGRPKMIGSLIPKIPAGRDSLPKTFILSDLAKNDIIITRPSVDPPPPKLQKKSEKPAVKMFVILRPA